MSFPKLTATHHRDTYPSISPTKPSLSQAGRNILITGGGSGIGFEIARSFAKASAAKIIIVGRRAQVLEEASVKLRQEFRGNGSTEFIAHQADVGSDFSVASLWAYLHSQNIIVHVLVLNAAHAHPRGPDTLSLDKKELMRAFDINIGGNFLMSANFVKQALRPEKLKLYLINVSTAAIHMYPSLQQSTYSTSKSAFTTLLGHIANERSVEDLQIVSYHPGALYTESAAEAFTKDAFPWDDCTSK